MNASERKNITNLAQKIIDGSINIIEGCRQISSLKIEKEMRDNSDFLIIRGFESETDEYPLGIVRKNYNQESLRKLDKEIMTYLNESKPVILEACKNLIKKYGNSNV
ncbi:MAG: hypothetical protein A2X77_06070 [Gammaproteobacteria bacterium GWE2_42_36]|nr:MAG: hypothetical protein A2X77_06070 [Gammaproteobacteria bacterium GWE2_42_36]HCU05793.1 hypothetical protein [Coxiellaceae bacterium]